jgi:hypothetical protein
LNDEWKHESFPLAEFTGDLLIRFRDVCGFGNNLYLDDIMVSFPSGFAGNPLPETCRVYPNPASDMISITGLPAGAGIEITDMAGKVLLTRSTLNDPAKIDISSLPKGIYLLRSGLVVKKIVRI